MLLGLALATKQHIALLLPVIAALAATGLAAHGGCGRRGGGDHRALVLRQPAPVQGLHGGLLLHGVARFDSISLWHFLPGPIAPVLPVLALLGSYWLVYRRIARTPGGLLVGFAVVLFAFDLFNKQSFENQWWFVCELLVCGLALSVAGVRTGARERSRRQAGSRRRGCRRADQSSRTGISSE